MPVWCKAVNMFISDVELILLLLLRLLWPSNASLELPLAYLFMVLLSDVTVTWDCHIYHSDLLFAVPKVSTLPLHHPAAK